MTFRILEISNPAELHINSGQLLVIQNERTIQIPVEDLNQIILIGPNIRLSSMDLTILTQNNISIMTLDEQYLPSAIVLPFVGNTMQSQIIHEQAKYPREAYHLLWCDIIRQKIANQAYALSILGIDGREIVSRYGSKVNIHNVDEMEALAARDYFQLYSAGLNRRIEDPINSRLNYGYAILRSAIARSIVSAGCHPAFGIHHNNHLNAFNLVDDLIEPFRPILDILVHQNMGENERLNTQDRRMLALVLYLACEYNHSKISVLSAIQNMSECYKRILLKETTEPLILPTILPIEIIPGVTE